MRRSMLFVPGNTPKMMTSCGFFGADAITRHPASLRFLIGRNEVFSFAENKKKPHFRRSEVLASSTLLDPTT